MEAKIKNYLMKKYHLGSYQIAQITFLLKSIGSELSKIVIMGILFHGRFAAYLFALFIMACLRCTTGGLHFYTYAGCLAASILYLWTALYILPHIRVAGFISTVLLLACILACYSTGPVTSRYRTTFSSDRLKKCRSFACGFIFIFTLAMYIIPEKGCMTTGFWVIILHSLQLMAAKIIRKGES